MQYTTEPPPSTLRSSADRIVSAIAGAFDGLAELLRFIAQSAAVLAGLGSAACQSGRRTEPQAEPIAVSIAAEAPVDAGQVADAGPVVFGTFQITFYYVASEEESDPAPRPPAATAVAPAVGDAADPVASGDPDTNLAATGRRAGDAAGPFDVDGAAGAGAGPDIILAAAAPERVTLFGPGCSALTDVSSSFASDIEMQGTGKLRDGRVLNISGPCGCANSPCFHVTGSQWGTSGMGRPLAPFRTVAVDPRVIPLGTLLYIPALEGRQMPGRAPWGGFVHDGCVVAEDTGGGIKGKQVDFFVGRRGYYKALGTRGGSHAWASHAEVQDGSALCRREGREVHRATPEAM